MQEVKSLCTDSQALRVEYCVVGIPRNTAIQYSVTSFIIAAKAGHY